MTAVRATESFRAPGFDVTKGQEFDSAAPIVVACPHLFEPVPPFAPATPKPKRAAP